MNPVERVDLIETKSSYLTLMYLGRPATLLTVARYYYTVVLGAKASAARQPMKSGSMYTPNMSNHLAISFVDSVYAEARSFLSIIKIIIILIIIKIII